MTDISKTSTEPPEAGIDIAGIGKAMRAIPPIAWQQIVETACTTFEKTLSPITETASGIGRLIKARFDRLVDVEQVMAAESIASAKRKAEESGQPVRIPRPQILLQVIENASKEVDGGVRELWSNLLAQEMVTQGIHPEVGRVLARLSFEDAQLLVAIAETQSTTWSSLFAQAVTVALKVSPFGIAVSLKSDPRTFNHAHLENLGLIHRRDAKWQVTVFGEGFIRAVTDPSIKAAATNEEADMAERLSPAATFELANLGLSTTALAAFEQLHKLVLEICPDCLVKQRGDAGWIYVPPCRRNAYRDKNLLTIKPGAAAVRMRIMPDDGERFDASLIGNYRTRLATRHQALIALGAE